MSPTLELKYAVNAILTRAALNAEAAKIRSTLVKDTTLTISGSVIDVTAPPVCMSTRPHRGEDRK